MKRIEFLSGLVMLLMLSGPALGLTIDEFNTGPNISLDVGENTHVPALPKTAQQVDNVPAVIGGYRDVYIEHISGDTNKEASVTFAPVDDYLSYSNDDGIKSELTLTYDANGAGLGGVDLTDGGTVGSLVMRFLTSDLGANCTVTITDTSANTLMRTLATGAGGGDLIFNFAAFTGTGDPADADSLVFFIKLDEPSGDHSIDFIKSGNVPEPMTMAGLMLGLGALGGYIRRRKA